LDIQMIDLSRNWAGNQMFQSQNVHRPATITELQQLVSKCERVKPVGTRHSFSPIADTSGDTISMEHFNEITGIDHDQMTVTVGAGAPYGTFCAELNNAGYAVHNMASLPQITVGGACATATHGSGDKNGNLATAVTALSMVSADGELVHLTRENDADFPAVVVGLGGFGVISHLTLEIRPTYSVRQDVYENLPVAKLADQFDEIMACGYSVSLFTDWQGDCVNQLWVKQIVDDTGRQEIPDERFGARLAGTRLHPSPGKSIEHCTDQLGASGPWHERLPHFRMDAIGPSGDELQTEYFVAREHGPAALLTVAALQEELAPVIKTSEVRTVAEDNLWMSPSYQAACVGIHFTWKPDWSRVERLLPAIEDALAPYEPRPHWGKLFSVAPEAVASRYPRLVEFRGVMSRYDPTGKFRNELLDRYIFGE
jgi:alditol oxidase